MEAQRLRRSGYEGLPPVQALDCIPEGVASPMGWVAFDGEVQHSVGSFTFHVDAGGVTRIGVGNDIYARRM